VKRRQFLGWIGVAATAVGMGSLLGWSRDDDSSSLSWPDDMPKRDLRARMNGRACHDFRMMSDDHSLFIDRKMLDV
jgi:hypothetical protein